jgi:ABC-type branched-subunit amino acid transport system substrate-binding protein
MAAAGIATAADLVIAHIAPYSGQAAAIGKEYGDGARLYFDHVNSQGGIQGSRIVLVARDDAGNAERTRMAGFAAVNDKPIAFIGTVGAGSVNSLIPTLRSLQAPLLGPVVDAAGVGATRSSYVFHIGSAPAREVESLAGELYALGLIKIALCYTQDDTGWIGAQDAQTRLARRNISVLVVARCDGSSATVQAAAEAVVAANSQAVIFAGQTQSAAAFIQTLRAKGSFALVAASSSVDPRMLVSMLPPESATWLAVAQSIPNPSSRATARVEAIVRELLKLRAETSSDMSLSRASLAGFLTAKIAVEAIRRAGMNPTGADVLNALAQLRDYDVGGLTVDFSGNEPGGIHYTRLGIIGRTGVVLN